MEPDMLAAYGIMGLTLLGGNAPGLSSFLGAPLPYFSLLAVCCVYIGSKRGLKNKVSTTPSPSRAARLTS